MGLVSKGKLDTSESRTSQKPLISVCRSNYSFSYSSTTTNEPRHTEVSRPPFAISSSSSTARPSIFSLITDMLEEARMQAAAASRRPGDGVLYRANSPAASLLGMGAAVVDSLFTLLCRRRRRPGSGSGATLAHSTRPTAAAAMGNVLHGNGTESSLSVGGPLELERCQRKPQCCGAQSHPCSAAVSAVGASDTAMP